MLDIGFRQRRCILFIDRMPEKQSPIQEARKSGMKLASALALILGIVYKENNQMFRSANGTLAGFDIKALTQGL